MQALKTLGSAAVVYVVVAACSASQEHSVDARNAQGGASSTPLPRGGITSPVPPATAATGGTTAVGTGCGCDERVFVEAACVDGFAELKFDGVSVDEMILANVAVTWAYNVGVTAPASWAGVGPQTFSPPLLKDNAAAYYCAGLSLSSVRFVLSKSIAEKVVQ